MTHWMISFPSGEMRFEEHEFDDVVRESHQVVRDMKAAGVYLTAGGVDESVPPVRVSADGAETAGTYPQTARLEGGYTIIDVPTREEAVAWAARLAAACRCDQELRAFQDDPDA